ncbi:MAG: hypothetical protein PWQ51_1719 [Methanolobus sp.]|jgi:hypothetical protein|uniref:Uncharacterized protein n=1 Tax=Methanolobus tindarius DSM 2278 TaxID=1090322 RepID=W9DYQ1_METTI|nr:hypothetical protein [Methanolobus tindarius]ETA68511.1 hypothetical protein MettiDRAFT_1984 [Methanolobus tindarius DSM 2278]MDI3485204.1 hypothetical protein [Methanolobus sp.]MDK2939554.1 hypothetical protein [Methanolobus sp.]
MCIENTYHIASDDGDSFSLDLVPRTTFINSPEVKELMLCLKDDIALRNFFIQNNRENGEDGTEEDNDTTQFLAFVKNSKIIPHSILKIESKSLHTYFETLSKHANLMFNSLLNRNIDDVCEKAKKTGIIEIDSCLCSIQHEGKSTDIICSKEEYESLPVSHELIPLIHFYKLSDSFYELWIKREKAGLLLEVWLYHSLKEHFNDDPNYDIYHSVNLRKEGKDVENIDELLDSENENNSFTVSEIDILINYQKKPMCVIECKNKKSNMQDVMKLKGLMTLLQINKGILFTKDFISTVGNSEIFNQTFVQSKAVSDLDSISKVIKIIESQNDY